MLELEQHREEHAAAHGTPGAQLGHLGRSRVGQAQAQGQGQGQGQWSVVSGQWSVVSGQWSVVSGQGQDWG